jgi:choline dehydrogenase-like flavoprotein
VAPDPAHSLECDAVVVGSGSGGGVMAAELAEAGFGVVVLEEGGYHRTEEFGPRPGETARKLYRDGGMSIALGSPPVLFQEGMCVGGSTVVNGAMSWRTPQHVLERWSMEEGVEGILPEETEPYFARVERFLSTSTQDPDSIGRDQALLRRGAEARGWQVVENLRAQVHCAGCNNCTLGCPTGAKQSVLVSYLPRALAFGAKVFANARVERVLFRGKRAIGVAGRTARAAEGSARGRPFEVRARAVVVCAGAIQTPALLLRSGLRSPSGMLGRNLSMHPNAKVVAIFDEPVEGWKGVHQAYQVREFRSEGILMAAVNLPPGLLAATLPRYGAALGEVMGEYDRIVTAGVLVEDTATGRVRALGGGRALATYQVNDRDYAKLVRALSLLTELLFAAGARHVLLPFDGMPGLLGPDRSRAVLAEPPPKATMEVVTVHMMGTAAMGRDRSRHVCDSHGRVYDAEGLFVADASLFPSPIGVNPMETIMALATRNAQRLIEARAAGRAVLQ